MRNSYSERGNSPTATGAKPLSDRGVTDTSGGSATGALAPQLSRAHPTLQRDAAAAFAAVTSPITPTKRGRVWDQKQQQQKQQFTASVAPTAAAAAAASADLPAKRITTVQGLRLQKVVKDRDVLVSPISTPSSRNRAGSLSPRSAGRGGRRSYGRVVNEDAPGMEAVPAGFGSIRTKRLQRSNGERLLPSPWKRSSECQSQPTQTPSLSPPHGGGEGETSALEAERSQASSGQAVAVTAAENSEETAAPVTRNSGVSDEIAKNLQGVRLLWERRASADSGWDVPGRSAEKRKALHKGARGRLSSPDIETSVIGVGNLKVNENGGRHLLVGRGGWGGAEGGGRTHLLLEEPRMVNATFVHFPRFPS